jgi:hypothetical protein
MYFTQRKGDVMSDTPFATRAYNLGLKIVPNMCKALTLEQLEYYEDHLAEIPDALRRGFVLPAVIKPLEKFALLADIGIITVPADYSHTTALALFREANREKFYGYDNAITDTNFSNPSRVLKPGDKLWIRAWKQTVSGTTTSRERMALLATLKSHHVGAQGISLVFKQKRDQLPKGYWYLSMDERERLWEDAAGLHRVPELYVYSYGGFRFDLGSFEHPWHGGDAILSFCDVPSGT